MIRTSPSANVALPGQSMWAERRWPSSRSRRYPQTVAKSPTGTETRKTSRQLIGARMPPRINPMKEPLKAAAWFTPRARPRWSSGKASVRMAAELAMSMAAPTPWKMRITMR